LRRLFSTFARGWPGAGLLLMRMVAGITLIDRGLTRLWSDPAIQLTILSALGIGAALLLLAGLWTPIVGNLIAVIELWNAFSRSGDPSAHVLLATLGLSLALLGPGAWSVDARLFGWKRIDLPARKS
jgi:putative oxidoreductase